MDINLASIRKVFFVGIGGIGISAIARMMLQAGKEVYGSDMSASEITNELVHEGAHISIGQNFDLIPKDVDLVVYTIAIKHYDPALMESVFEMGVPVKSYPEMLHIVTNDKHTIAVSGTHGKTTTTAMIAKIFMDTKKDPSVIVGSLLKGFQSNLIVGGGEDFIVEACEYERSFLNIEPKILVITNIEADHLDYYRDLADIQNAFSELVMQTGSAVVCDPNDPVVATVVGNTNVKVIDYTQYFDRVPKLAVPGEHNRKNAAAALAVADFAQIPAAAAAEALSTFAGTWRRLEKRGATKDGAIVYDDYAHHPTEIRASLEALRELYPKGEKKITVIFQPHLYSRTKAFFNEFATAFNQADTVYFLPIYFAREVPDPTVSSEILAEAVAKNVAGARAFASFEEAEQFCIEARYSTNDVFVTMGAGEAYKVGDQLL
ncbi:MAG: cyanophycin synthetase [bacterium]